MKVNKNWVTDILVDLAVSSAIICAVIIEYQWLTYIVIGYSFLLLLIKLLVVVSDQVRAITKKGKSNAPAWVYHLLYAFNTAALIIFGWYLTAIAWLVIWVLSAYISKN